MTVPEQPRNDADVEFIERFVGLYAPTDSLRLSVIAAVSRLVEAAEQAQRDRVELAEWWGDRFEVVQAREAKAMETLFKCAIAAGEEVTRDSWRALDDPLTFVFESVLALRTDYDHCPTPEALALAESRLRTAEQAQRENVRLTGILARLRPDIDPATGYGKREGI